MLTRHDDKTKIEEIIRLDTAAMAVHNGISAQQYLRGRVNRDWKKNHHRFISYILYTIYNIIVIVPNILVFIFIYTLLKENYQSNRFVIKWRSQVDLHNI